jgi:ribosomal protein S18 acetylase RimI-like enzyme
MCTFEGRFKTRRNMIEIIPATTDNIPDIQKISSVAWPHTFKDILSEEQIAYMMHWMYSDESLREQMEKQHHRYVLAKHGEEFVAYLSYEPNCENTGKTKIHKIYILPSHQRKGIGKLLFNFVMTKARETGEKAVYLNVNKNNRNAIDFYRRMGFYRAKEEVIDIGNGFVMDDYVFEKPLDHE